MQEARFYSNETETKFLDKIRESLEECFSFSWSVSFIKKAGLILIYKEMESALKRGARGRVITSTYQNFTDIAALQMLLRLQDSYPNFECRLEDRSFGESGFHTKGYLFEYDDGTYESIIGSSNITRFALLLNKEWDLGVSENYESQDLRKDIAREFDSYWEKTNRLSIESIQRYEKSLSYAIVSWDMDYDMRQNVGQKRPNLMQRKALMELQRQRNMNCDKAMVIAATGSGKTYLAAFDAKFVDAKRLLFVVHKDTILHEAMKTFMDVFGNSRTYGIYDGNSDEIDRDFVFASNQMLSRHLELFARDEFDYIVIDEVHHAAASTYRKIIEHFKPSFLLGLTATPDRMDGQDVYDMFGNNVPFDLRIREALENDLIVPFRYFGIKDDLVSYESDGTGVGNRMMVSQLSSSIHCEFIREQIEGHRVGGKLRCIGFCKSVDHARQMAEKMSLLGYGTTYLEGGSSTGERLAAFERLEKEDDPLEIIFAVDILNEGIDIPSINMVLFLRPTDSSTIFIQQLGRGLRKYKDKEYLVVLDFIANSYKRSAQIAIALGSLSKSGVTDKLALSSMVRSSFSSLGIKGIQIQFDEKAREEILESIQGTNFNSLKFIKQDYQNFKEYLKLGPSQYIKHSDFLNQDADVDLLRFTRKFSSYHDFLERIGEDVPSFTTEGCNAIASIFHYLPLVRPYEYLILKSLLDGERTYDELLSDYRNMEGFDKDSFDHALRMLQDEFSYSRPKEHIKLMEFDDGKYSLSFKVENKELRSWMESLIGYGLERYDIDFHGEKGQRLKKYYRYTGTSSLMALNSNNLFRMTGIQMVKGRRVIYIDLNKDSVREEHLKYKDEFLSSDVIQWESQTDTTLENKKGLDLVEYPRVLVFVRKAKNENGAEMPFIYVGEGTLTNPRTSDNEKHTLMFDISLDEPVPSLYFDDLGVDPK